MKKFFVIPLVFLLLAATVHAVSIGVSPGRINYETLLQDGYAERTITITTNTDQVLVGHFNVRGEIADWLSFEPNSTVFNVTRDSPYKLKIIIQPPADIQNGNYTGRIEYVTDTIGAVAGRAGGIVKASVTQILNSEISGEQIVDCRAGGFKLNNIEEGFPLELGYRVINDGNVRITPTVDLDFWDQLQENIVDSKRALGNTVLPTTEERMDHRIANTLPIGQYWAQVAVEECQTSELLTFSVVERGGISDEGELASIFNKPWAAVGETVEFLAKFRNIGARGVTAKFKGTIRHDDAIVQIVDTEEILVGANADNDFSIFFTPQQPGRYVLSGRVIYNQKLTFEKSSVLNVETPEGEEKGAFALFPLLLYIIIIITILFILRKIIKERKRKF